MKNYILGLDILSLGMIQLIRVDIKNILSRFNMYLLTYFQDLKDLMRRAGEVTYANAHNEKRNEG